MSRVCRGYDGFDGTENFDYVSPQAKQLPSLKGIKGDYQIELMPMGLHNKGKYVVWYQDSDICKWYGLAILKTDKDARIVIDAHEAFQTVVHELEND